MHIVRLPSTTDLYLIEATPLRALIADDSGVIRSIAKRALTELGFEVIHEAVDGKDGIEMVNRFTYDMIVTDWNMPHFTGLDVIKAARAAGQTCPIVMQTTEPDKAKVMEAIAAGVNDYVLKPFNKEQLFQKLEKHVVSV